MAKLTDQQIKEAREKNAVELIEHYGVDVEKKGKEHFALCPFHSEKSPSFTVNPDMGRYYCHGCGAQGDNIQFVMDYEGVPFREAVQRILGAVESDVSPRERREIDRGQPAETWSPMAVVPDSAPITPDTKYLPAPADFVAPKSMHSFIGRDGVVLVKHVATRRWAYRNAAGALIGYILRFDRAWGGKEVVPQTFCVDASTGECSWRWLSFAKLRPMYGLELLAANPKAQVLLVEGEKDCDAARERFGAVGVGPNKLVVLSWPGGGKGVKHVDWSPLHGRRVALWPDADQKHYPALHARAGEMMPFIEQPGTVAMYDIHAKIAEHCDTIKLIVPPAGVPDGWGLADELPAGFDLLAHMKTAAALTAAAAAPAPAAEPEAKPTPPWEDLPSAAAAPAPQAPAPAAPKSSELSRSEQRAEDHDALEDSSLTQNGYFRALGYDHDRYYILQHEKGQIVVYTKSDFSESGLLELAPLDWWEAHFPGGGKQGGIDKRAAMNWMIRKANSRGVYSMTRLRGRGAWTDKGRLVFHHGDYLTVDGKPCEIHEMRSHYVYETAEALPDIPQRALTCEEGMDLLELAQVFRWAKPASAALMAGWCALAPVGGAIKWRPHIWLGGGPGSGKSTALGRYVHHLMNGMDVFANGNSSEAGIRQTLKGDARPVLFDESEQNNEREAMRVQQVLSMVRQASTESQALTLKGTAGGDAMAFHIRSMFCLASIQVGLKQQADIERMTVLNIRPKRDDPDPADTWERIDEALHVMQRDETLPGRLVRRSLELLPVTLQNIVTFSKAAAMKFGSQRDGDQYGTLMAGAWSLTSRELINLEGARSYLDQYDWSEHREQGEVDESERALAALMGSLIRIHGGAEVTVNELIRVALGYEVDGVSVSNANAEAVLQRHGMRTDGKRLVLSNTSSELRRLVEGTAFEADLRGVLLRLRGAERYHKTVKFSGVATRAISIPLDDVLDDEIALPPQYAATNTAPF